MVTPMRAVGSGCLGVLVVLITTAARADVTIDRQPGVVERKTFDPKHPPADMPPLTANEAALTQTRFECGTAVSYQVLDRKKSEGHCATTILVRNIKVTLQLRTVIWLPERANAKLRAHEEGHRQIADRVYAGAEAIARKAAAGLDAKSYQGDSNDCPDAEKKAISQVSDPIDQAYLNQTAEPASRINDIYDEITGHGTKAEPAEDEAIRQAFSRATTGK